MAACGAKLTLEFITDRKYLFCIISVLLSQLDYIMSFQYCVCTLVTRRLITIFIAAVTDDDEDAARDLVPTLEALPPNQVSDPLPN